MWEREREGGNEGGHVNVDKIRIRKRRGTIK